MIQKATPTTPTRPLKELADRTQTREEFVAFAKLLAGDSQNGDGWGNRELGPYLEAIAGWTEDLEGYYRNRGEPVPAQPSWRMLAQMLLAGRVYE